MIKISYPGGNENLSTEELLRDGAKRLKGSGISQSRAEVEILMASVLDIPRWKLYLQKEETLSPEAEKKFQIALGKREKHTPLSYITGKKEFYGYEFKVSPSVLIPRPETEILIETAISIIRESNNGKDEKLCIADLGTGSGAIAVTLALLIPHAEIWALDSSLAALEIAAENASYHKVASRINFVAGRFIDIPALFPKSINMIITNPPYICSRNIAQLPPHIKDYEPLSALDGGEDGLNCYREILDALTKTPIAPPAIFLSETGEDSLSALKALCSSHPAISSFSFIKDYRDFERVLKATVNA